MIMVSYADETLIVSVGDTVEVVQDYANAALVTFAEHIRVFGLRLAVDKTEVAGVCS